MTSLRRGLSLAAVLALTASTQAAPPGLDQRVTIEVRQAPISSFLDSLSAQTKLNFIMDEGLESEKVTAFLHDVTAEDALNVLKDVKGVDYRRMGQGRTFLLAAKDSPLLRQPAAIEGGKELDARVSIRVKQAPLDQFLASLSSQTKLNFALADGLEDTKVTAYLQDVSAREAIEIILALKGLTCRRLEAQKTYTLAPARSAQAR